MFHDETLPIKGVHPFTGHGLLYVPAESAGTVAQRLRDERDGYDGEVHFAEVRGASGQQPQFRVARRWVALFFDELIDSLAFKAAIAIHDGPRPIPYPDERTAYQRHMLVGTRHTFVGLTRFALTGYDEIQVDPVFDDTGNPLVRNAYQWAVHQFAYRANKRRRDGDRRYPEVRTSQARFVTSDPVAAVPELRDDSELLQLTDVLLGAAEESLDIKQATRHGGRIQLARDVASGMAEHWGGSRLRYSRRARHFTVTLWPDKFGFLYPALPSRRPVLDVPRMPFRHSFDWELSGTMAPWPK